MKPLIIGGHSLGAGRAAHLAAIASLAGRPPVALINFGEPKPGFKHLVSILQNAGVDAMPHCNGDDDGHDLVFDVPFSLPGCPYIHTGETIRVSEPPTDPDAWDVFRYHHMPLYLAAVKRLPMPVASTTLSTADVADLCNGIYAYPGETPISWDHYDDGTDSDGVCWAVKKFDSADVVVFRGSTTQEDWFRDFDHLALPWTDKQLGPVHPGFLLGMHHVWEELSAVLPWPP